MTNNSLSDGVTDKYNIYVFIFINNLFIRNVIWNDQSVGLITRFKVYNLIFNGNIESVSSNNYLWESGLNTKNLYIYLSTIIVL